MRAWLKGTQHCLVDRRHPRIHPGAEEARIEREDLKAREPWQLGRRVRGSPGQTAAVTGVVRSEVGGALLGNPW